MSVNNSFGIIYVILSRDIFWMSLEVGHMTVFLFTLWLTLGHLIHLVVPIPGCPRGGMGTTWIDRCLNKQMITEQTFMHSWKGISPRTCWNISLEQSITKIRLSLLSHRVCQNKYRKQNRIWCQITAAKWAYTWAYETLKVVLRPKK